MNISLEEHLTICCQRSSFSRDIKKQFGSPLYNDLVTRSVQCKDLRFSYRAEHYCREAVRALHMNSYSICKSSVELGHHDLAPPPVCHIKMETFR